MKVEYSNYLLAELFKVQSLLKNDTISNKWRIEYLDLRINNIFMNNTSSIERDITDDYDPKPEFVNIPEASCLLSYKDWLIKRRNGRIKEVLAPGKG